jgi:hypothetical protein
MVLIVVLQLAAFLQPHLRDDMRRKRRRNWDIGMDMKATDFRNKHDLMITV